MARYINIDNTGEHPLANDYIVTLHLVENDTASVRIEVTRHSDTIEIQTRADAYMRTWEARLTRNDTERGCERVVQVELARDPDRERDTGCIQIATPGEIPIARIECDSAEWRQLWLTMLNVVLAHRETTDRVKLAAPVLTDPETIRTRVLQCIAESRANDGAEVDCLDVRLDDAEATLGDEQITTEGGCFMGTGIYDLDIVTDARIDARLRVRR